MRALRIVVGAVAIVLVVGCSIVSAQSGPSRVPFDRSRPAAIFSASMMMAKPEIVYWLATRGDGGTLAPSSVSRRPTAFPVLVERCKAAPTASFAKTVRAHAEKPWEETLGSYRDR